MSPISKTGPSYQKIHRPDSPSTEDERSDGTPEHSFLSSSTIRRPFLMPLIYLGLLLLSFSLGVLLARHYGSSDQCEESDLAWSPAKDLARRHWHRFDGSINATNVFKGDPHDRLEEAWNRFTHNQWIDGTAVVLAVTQQEMGESGNAESIATVADLGEENGGGPMATLEIFHQLHCLNLLRKWTYVDYYSSRDDAWTHDRASSLRRHTDHCIDILRQVLMCNGDMGLVMFHWIKGVGPAPYPDFSTVHQCRDPVAILEAAEKVAAPIVRPVTKTSVAHELPTFP